MITLVGPPGVGKARLALAVAELCRRLDGLPLAIELVAARVKLLPPTEVLKRLHGSWLLSVDGLRDGPARQWRLRGAIGWSYDLLAPVEQTLYMRLAGLVGGCTLEAAEMTCADVLSPAQACLTDSAAPVYYTAPAVEVFCRPVAGPAAIHPFALTPPCQNGVDTP